MRDLGSTSCYLHEGKIAQCKQVQYLKYRNLIYIFMATPLMGCLRPSFTVLFFLGRQCNLNTLGPGVSGPGLSLNYQVWCRLM